MGEVVEYLKTAAGVRGGRSAFMVRTGRWEQRCSRMSDAAEAQNTGYELGGIMNG
jgi:hypothetical protein